MRVLAVVPVLCCTAALILSFLCLFAGHKKGFMEDYDLLTLNTSRIGQNLLNESSSPSSDNPFSDLFNSLSNEFSETVNDAIGDVAEKLGIDDFYSAHILDYCAGQYTPAEVANDTVRASDIRRNVTECSNATAMYTFDPNAILEAALNESGVDVTLDDLRWPEDIQRGLDALRVASVATFVLYCMAIGLIFFALILAVPAIFANGRLVPCLNLMLAILAFLSIGLASALVTALIVKGSDVINRYGNEIGVEAQRGNKFLAITWAATGLMFVTLVVWSVDICLPRRKAYTAKHG